MFFNDPVDLTLKTNSFKKQTKKKALNKNEGHWFCSKVCIYGSGYSNVFSFFTFKSVSF